MGIDVTASALWQRLCTVCIHVLQELNNGLAVMVVHHLFPSGHPRYCSNEIKNN